MAGKHQPRWNDGRYTSALRGITKRKRGQADMMDEVGAAGHLGNGEKECKENMTPTDTTLFEACLERFEDSAVGRVKAKRLYESKGGDFLQEKWSEAARRAAAAAHREHMSSMKPGHRHELLHGRIRVTRGYPQDGGAEFNVTTPDGSTGHGDARSAGEALASAEEKHSLATPGQKPYPGMGSHVVVQHIGNGDWVAGPGAASHEAASKKAKMYPGQTKVVPNGPGDEPHPGTYYRVKGTKIAMAGGGRRAAGMHD